MKRLINPTSLATLNVDNGIRKRFADTAKSFMPKNIEPIACFDVGVRKNAKHWLKLRHTGENDGEGVLGWSAIAQARYLGGEPALEALQFVKTYGGLSETEQDKIERRFQLTTLRRLMESRPVRERIGIDIKTGVIHSGLPLEELIKPLRQFVIDISEGNVTSRGLHTIQDQANYVDGLHADSRPNLSKVGNSRSITNITLSTVEHEPPRPRTKTITDPSNRAY